MKSIIPSIIIWICFARCSAPQEKVTGGEKSPVVSPDRTQLYGRDYFIDDQHSYIGFRIKYFGSSNVRGRFDRFKGTAFYDSSSNFLSVHLAVDATSINTGVAMRDSDLKAPAWLGTEKSPFITFESNGVMANDTGFDLSGELKLKNIKKPIIVKFEKPTKMTKDWAGNDQVDFTGSFSINRMGFGIGEGSWNKIMGNGFMQLSDDIMIELEIHARRPDYLIRKADTRLIDSVATIVLNEIQLHGVAAGMESFNKISMGGKKDDTWPTLSDVANVLLAEKKYADAIVVFERRTALHPERREGLNNLAIAYLLNGDLLQSKKNFDALLSMDSLNTKALEYLKVIQ